MNAVIPTANLTAQNAPHKEALERAFSKILDESAFCLGARAERFEREWADFCGAQHAVAVQSGTSALLCALSALGVGPGDEVITTPSTFVATVGAIHFLGARPVFVEIDPVRRTLDPARLEAAITSKTKAIVPVHLHGQVADMDPICAIAGRAGVPVLEDAAQAHGATYKGRPVGTIGQIATFSFYPGKNLGALGEAGAVITSDPVLARQARLFRNHGQEGPYNHIIPGLNLRIPGIQSAALSIKLPHLPKWNARRAQIARRYTEAFSGLPLQLPALIGDSPSVYHQYAIQTGRRAALQAFLKEHGVHTGRHYARPIHLTEAYAFLGHAPGDFVHAEALAQEAISLPIYAELSDDQVDRVTALVRLFFSEG